MAALQKLYLTVFLVFQIHAFDVIASSCCTGGGGQSICVLPSEQAYQGGVSVSYRQIQGHFDPYGYYSANPDGTSSNIVTTTLGGAYRLGEDWQAALTIPIVNNNQSLAGQSTSHVSFGDPTIEGRYLLWDDLGFMPYRPQLSFYSGLRLPVGTSIYNSTDPAGADVVGDGFTTAYLGANAVKLKRPFRFSLDETFFYPLAREVKESHSAPLAQPYTFKSGNRIQSVESVAYLFDSHWSSFFSLKQFWQFESSVDGNASQGSAGRLFSSILGVNYSYTASWNFSASFETVFPFYQYIANQPNYQAFTVAAFYAGF